MSFKEWGAYRLREVLFVQEGAPLGSGSPLGSDEGLRWRLSAHGDASWLTGASRLRAPLRSWRRLSAHRRLSAYGHLSAQDTSWLKGEGYLLAIGRQLYAQGPLSAHDHLLAHGHLLAQGRCLSAHGVPIGSGIGAFAIHFQRKTCPLRGPSIGSGRRLLAKRDASCLSKGHNAIDRKTCPSGCASRLRVRLSAQRGTSLLGGASRLEGRRLLALGSPQVASRCSGEAPLGPGSAFRSEGVSQLRGTSCLKKGASRFSSCLCYVYVPTY